MRIGNRELPGIGKVVWQDQIEYFVGQPLALRAFRGHACRLEVGEYVGDPNRDQLERTLTSFVVSPRDLLSDAEPYVYAYYQDCHDLWVEQGDEPLAIARADIWQHVWLGDVVTVGRRPDDDGGVYFSIAGGCAWEREHGLQLVFKDGEHVCKVGPFDSHFTNADAYDDPAYEDVVYRARATLPRLRRRDFR